MPDILVPYQRYDLKLMLAALNYQHQQFDITYQQTSDFIAHQGQDSDLPIETAQIRHFQQLFTQAFTKLITIPTLKNNLTNNCPQQPVLAMLGLIKKYHTPFKTTAILNSSNIQQLALDFYLNFQSEQWVHRHFLFGRPSQKRI